MTKIMLVEDDKSLREIYGVRLLAEGYDIVSAGDGEQALAMAIKERPNLIISDIMMPKISGFDLLDILRSTTETKNTKVIMMTALSSEDQRLRGEQLGADRYLVKSQVGIEDVVRVVHEVLGDGPQAAPAPQPQQAPMDQGTPDNQPPQPPEQPQPTPVPPAAAPQPAPQPQNLPPQPPPVPQQTNPMPRPMPPPTMPPSRINTQTPPTAAGSTVPKPAQTKSRVIQPINDPSEDQLNIKELLDKELAKEAGIAEDARPEVATVAEERADIDQQIAAFLPNAIEEEEQAIDSILHPDGQSAPDNQPPQPPEQPQPAPVPPAAAPQPAPQPQNLPPQPPTVPQPAPQPVDAIPMPPQPPELPQPTNFPSQPQQ